MPNPFVRKLEHGAILTAADRSVLVHLARHVRPVRRHQALTEEDAPSPRIHVLLEGWAGRSKFLANGQHQITDLVLPGDFCHPHTNLLARADHSVVMLTDGTVADVDPAEIAQVLAHHPGAARALHWSSLQADSLLRQALANNGHRLAEERVAHLICEVGARLRAVGQAEDDRFAWPITQTEFGAIVAISNVHVNRVLMALRAKNLISLRDRVMVVADRDRLMKYCDFRPHYLHLVGKSGWA